MSGVDLFNLTMFPDIYARVAERVGSAKQKDVAAALGITQAHINNLLAVARGRQLTKGPTSLPFKQLIEWAGAKGVSIDWLLTGQEPCAEDGQPPKGKDYVDLPPWDQARLNGRERKLVNWALDVLRSGDLLPNVATALETNIVAFRDSVEKEADRPRCHEPPSEPQGGQKMASGGGRQKGRAARAR